MKIIDNPVSALVQVGKENSELHEEQARTWAELDLYRDALTKISQMRDYPGAVVLATAALAQRRISA